MNEDICPFCYRTVRTCIPRGGDGSAEVFVRHHTKGPVRKVCSGSRTEAPDPSPAPRPRKPAPHPPSALEKIQSYDGSGRPGRAVAISDDQLRELWRKAGGSFHGPIVEHGSIEEAKLLPFLRSLLQPNAAEVGRLVHEAVAAAVKPLTPAELAGRGIQVENGYAILDERGKPRVSYSCLRPSPPPRGRVVKVRRITIWEKP